jgi:hypothetical protein
MPRLQPSAGACAWVALTLAAVGACAPDAPPADPGVLSGGQRTGALDPDFAARVRVADDHASAWVSHQLPVGVWERWNDSDRIWTAPRPDGPTFRRGLAEHLELSAPGRPFSPARGIATPKEFPDIGPDEFAVHTGSVVLGLAPDETPPEGLVFAVEKPRTLPGSTLGEPILGSWTGTGFSLWPGETMTFTADVPAGSALRFFAAAEGIVRSDGKTPGVTLAVTLDGEPLDEDSWNAPPESAGHWRTVALPPAPRRAARLAFTLSGDPAFGAVLAARIGPAAPAPPAERPGQPRSIVLFLADTFRADNMALWGGPPGLTPHLDELAARSVVFRRSWSNATMTLPAQTTMLTGLLPEQHGVVNKEFAIPEQAVTLAEVLQAHGYRTGAVTDSAFVSRNYGFQQGFEWFHEHRKWSLTSTLRAALAFLRADDGRPTFLFVQTYRVHSPYRTGPEESYAAAEAVMAEARARIREQGGDGSWTRAEAAARMRDVYREGARDLDAQFGPWVEELRALGFLEHGCLVFTSDHGEAFYEHTDAGHGGVPFEEKARIPLFFHGDWLAPHVSDDGASLVDLPTTLATLAGLKPLPHWEGRDLLASEHDPIVYNFVRGKEGPVVTLLDGPHKVMAWADPPRLATGEWIGASDLGRDPRELEEPRSATWPAELVRSQADEVRRLLEVVTPAREAQISEEDRAMLRHLGYGDE